MIATQNWPLIGALLVALLASLAFIVLTVRKKHNDLAYRLKNINPQTAGRSHSISPVLAAGLLPDVEKLQDSGFRGARRWLLSNGIEASPRKALILLSGGVLATVGIFLALGMPTLAAILSALTAAPTVMLFFGKQRLSARTKAAKQQFPQVLNLIVRTLKAGLTLEDAMYLVATDGPVPLRNEFLRALNDQGIGLSLPEACKRMAQRLPFDEAEFFALIVAIQSETGGSIVVALENLSETSDSRAALAEKIVIAGQEARASAAIIGSLPVLVLGVLWLVQPEFVSVLFVTLKGQVALGVAAISIVLGSFVMQEMAKFDV